MNPHYDAHIEAQYLREKLQRTIQENKELRDENMDLKRALKVMARRDLVARQLVDIQPGEMQ